MDTPEKILKDFADTLEILGNASGTLVGGMCMLVGIIQRMEATGAPQHIIEIASKLYQTIRESHDVYNHGLKELRAGVANAEGSWN